MELKPSAIRQIRMVGGGYTGYFADPDGFRWEIATNPAMEQLVVPD